MPVQNPWGNARVAQRTPPNQVYNPDMFVWNQIARAMQGQPTPVAAPMSPLQVAAMFGGGPPSMLALPPSMPAPRQPLIFQNPGQQTPFPLPPAPSYAPTRQSRPQQPSRPAPKQQRQSQPIDWGGVFSGAWNNTVGRSTGIPSMMRPQGGDEMRITYGARRAGGVGALAGHVAAAVGGSPQSMQMLFNDYAAPAIGKAARAVGQDVAQAFRYLTATPNSDIQRAYNAMIGQESGGRQSAVSNKGAVGVAQIMPGTGPEAAKLAGLPWDENRWRNDPAYNYTLGLAYFQKQVQANGGDVIAAMAAYNAGPGALRNAQRKAAQTGQPYTAFLPSETQNYIPSVLARMGTLAEGFGAPAPGFNAAPYQNAMAAQDQAAAMLSKPYSAAFSETPLPDRPTPTELQAPDFTQGNAAFEATRPKNPFDDPKEAVRIQRQQYFKGIGQAMAGLSGGEGIGTMLMKLGAGALMGRARGQEMVDEKEEQFEARMVEFNRALAARDDQQAITAANILNQNIQQRNVYADQVWADSVAQIQKKQPQVVNDKLVTYDRDPSDPNKWTMTVTPLGFGIQAEALLNKANIGIQMGQAQAETARFAYQSQQATARTALGLSTQMAMQQGDGQAAGEGYLTGAAMQARAAVRTGSWRQFFNDPNRADQLELTATQRAYTKLGIETLPNGQPKMPLDGTMAGQYSEAFEDALTDIIYGEAARLGQMDRLFNHSAGRTALVTQQTGSQRTTRRTDARGRTTTSQSWNMDE